jgi:hypothetical protein
MLNAVMPLCSVQWGHKRRAEDETNRQAVRWANGLKDGLIDKQTIGQSYGWRERQTEERRKYYFLSLSVIFLNSSLSLYITVCVSLLIFKERKTERLKGRQAERQAFRQTERQAFKQRNRQTNRETNRQADRQTVGQRD